MKRRAYTDDLFYGLHGVDYLQFVMLLNEIFFGAMILDFSETSNRYNAKTCH